MTTPRDQPTTFPLSLFPQSFAQTRMQLSLFFVFLSLLYIYIDMLNHGNPSRLSLYFSSISKINHERRWCHKEFAGTTGSYTYHGLLTVWCRRDFGGTTRGRVNDFSQTAGSAWIKPFLQRTIVSFCAGIGCLCRKVGSCRVNGRGCWRIALTNLYPSVLLQIQVKVRHFHINSSC
jgi:hypothetical protein